MRWSSATPPPPVASGVKSGAVASAADGICEAALPLPQRWSSSCAVPMAGCRDGCSVGRDIYVILVQAFFFPRRRVLFLRLFHHNFAENGPQDLKMV
jgi:hypothetical protein